MELVRILITDAGKFELYRDGDQYTLRYVAGEIDNVGNFVPRDEAREVALQRPEDDQIIESADDISLYMAKFGI